jgi:hypothetical protein
LGLGQYADAKHAPDAKQMCIEAGLPMLYEQYRLWSTETHVGLGSMIRTAAVSHNPVLGRSETLLFAADEVQECLAALVPTVPEAEVARFRDGILAYRSTYYEPTQEAFWSVLFSETFDQPRLSEALMQLKCSTEYRQTIGRSSRCRDRVSSGSWLTLRR